MSRLDLTEIQAEAEQFGCAVLTKEHLHNLYNLTKRAHDLEALRLGMIEALLTVYQDIPRKHWRLRRRVVRMLEEIRNA